MDRITDITSDHVQSIPPLIVKYTCSNCRGTNIRRKRVDNYSHHLSSEYYCADCGGTWDNPSDSGIIYFGDRSFQ